MTPTKDQIEAGAKAIYESKLLVQPREPWDGPDSATKIFCRQAAEACFRSMTPGLTTHLREIPPTPNSLLPERPMTEDDDGERCGLQLPEKTQCC